MQKAVQDWDGSDFVGAKVAVYIGQRLLITRRDDFAHIDYPGLLDLPGGGREPGETPLQTAAREMDEEVGLRLEAGRLLWGRQFPHALKPGPVWYFVLALPEGAEADITFGDEGQGWALMTPEAFLAAPDAIQPLQDRLRLYLAQG
ncbi:NUDIX domain-containing protein [Pseudoroseicyclus aestuarii]|uniref:8-oxo-dGTP diphosphatase n=1 Tax=Pseudoroseicyclus aestuarii TaxID=1795041 RepID=A0A318SV45_9RHOB|nr:NUDIX hydrolase [Pseudoroseicyclus aestuarii]PYE84219.1 8-oxo-dGTP diphosphatase [Pseudoroseicyclus aestuarii]